MFCTKSNTVYNKMGSILNTLEKKPNCHYLKHISETNDA